MGFEESHEAARWARLCEAEWIARLKMRLWIARRVSLLQSAGVLMLLLLVLGCGGGGIGGGDGSVIDPPPLHEVGALRCSDDLSAVEAFDGDAWRSSPCESFPAYQCSDRGGREPSCVCRQHWCR